ncbi:unnamed protein product [Rhodiola kirilowii]
MELSNAQHQEMGTDSLENMLICTKAQQEMRKPRPQQEQALKCPRCDSTNTKFCYYNNYSLTQPRYFCKSCRRYWTNGGTLRNVPVGGSCRKNKRPSSSSSSKRSISVNSDNHNQQLLPHHHHHQPHLLNSSSDTLQSPFSAFSSHMSSYDNEYPTTDLSHVFPRLLQKQSCGYESELYDHHQQHNHALEHNLSLLGNYSNNTHFGNIMGLNNAAAATTRNNNNISGHGFLEGLKANLLNNNTASSTNFNNLYNGFPNNNNNNSSVSNINGDQIMIPYENLSSNFGSKTSALKQEDHHLNDNNRSSQVLWGAAAAGFPWHQISSYNNNIGGVHGDNNNMVNDIDLVRENINVFAAPVWHGLINSPLM